MNAVSDLRLCDIATHDVLTVTADSSLQQVINVFVEKRVSSIVVLDDGKPVGIVTERDLLRLICSGYDQTKPVRSVMSTPLLTARQEMNFCAAQTMMSNLAIRHLVLVDEAGCLRGVASETDFRRHISHDLFAAIQNLRHVIEPSVEVIEPACCLARALETMASQRLDHLLIGHDGVPQGIITERDVPRLMASHVDTSAVTVGEVMSSPLQSIGTEVSVADAARQMEKSGLRHLLVLDAQGRMAGVVSQHRMLERLSVVFLEQGREWLAGQLDVVLEATGVGTWEFDHQRDVMLRSTALNKVLSFGSEAREESLTSILQRIEPEDRQQIEMAVKHLLSEQTDTLSVDYRVCDGVGRVRWFSSRGRVIERDAQGRPLRSAGVAIDIDAQKQAEMEARRNAEHLHALMEKLPIPLCRVDGEERLLFTNQHFVETFGYRIEDVPDLASWWQRAYPDEKYREWVLENWQAAVKKAAENGSVIRSGEYRVTCANGEQRIVEISGITLDEQFLATFNDVTELRQQQHFLEFSNAILRRISTALPLREVLEFICRGIESEVVGTQCAIMLVDEQQRLQTGAAPNLPVEYTRLVDGVQIGPAVGSCGTAAFRGEPVFAGEIATDPLWADFAGLAATYGFGACWSSPIKAPDGMVVGTFALYWPYPVAHVSAVAQSYVEAATALTAIAIESDRRDARLRKQLDELRRWQRVMLGREGRVLELKQEVNALRARLGESPRYAAAAGDDPS